MPVPHLEIRIVQRSKGSSAVAGAAYQAGEKLFSEYDQKSKDHRRKQPEVLYTEIMFPANAPPEYADRATLWNAVEEVEKQWNSQLARRFILALPREVPTEMYPQMMQEYCREHFVSKGMCCDFAIHDPDPPGHNPHCHIMLTMRAIDENGKWLPKSRKVYDLDENGERIKLPSGRWKSHKEDTVDWNEQYLDTYEATHNYDEYHFYLDEIEHDPYVLISILSALHDGVFTLAEVQGELEMLFEKQYILTETVTMQIRYRTKTMLIIGPGGVPQLITYQEPYEYYICTVKLKNKDLSHLPVEVLTEEQLSAYSLYMRTLGNRPDLFGQAQYPNASTIKQPTYYDIPPEALKDDRFAAMMEEATKYIGYPYVWGGSSPSTSFDCSGYISWVLNHSGWNVGRQTAQGLYNLCTPVSAAQVKPGDLVFFKGTYDTPGVSHCGIYVGNSIMLHCGDPISYTNLNSKYWQEHFYSYGRLP